MMTETDALPLPFDGAITAFFRNSLPEALRERIATATPREILAADYPYSRAMPGSDYRPIRDALQVELVKLQSWVRQTGQRVVVVLEGRDAAGKGGAIRRFMEHLNPRGARVVALAKPSDTERTQWYFQRYIEHMPAGGEIVFFDRSWYNRGVVEHVFGFCTPAERALFFDQVRAFEEMLVRDGIHLFKLWLTIGRAEQMRRMLAREHDPLRHWKLSRIDIDSLARWDAYTDAIAETFAHSHSLAAPWTVIRADDKRRARIASQLSVLSALPYTRRDSSIVAPPDPSITGGPALIERCGA